MLGDIVSLYVMEKSISVSKILYVINIDILL